MFCIVIVASAHFFIVTVIRLYVFYCDSGRPERKYLKSTGLEHICFSRKKNISRWQLSVFLLMVRDSGIMMNCRRIRGDCK